MIDEKPEYNEAKIARLQRQQGQLLRIIEYMAETYTPWKAEDRGVVRGMLKSVEIV